MEKPPVLIVNEDGSISSHLSNLLSTLGYDEQLEMSHHRGLNWLGEGNLPLLILLNITQSGLAGLKFLNSMREVHPSLPVVVVGSSAQIRLVVEAVQLGAAEYLITPFDVQQAQLAIQRVLQDQRRNEPKLPAPDMLLEGGFSNPEMIRAYEIAKLVARTDVPVLITGESGVGKEVFARYIHSHSERATKPLIKVNCAALPNDLLESELFGYERGAFTGATVEKPGKFELANGGAILLDEIGEMSPNLQAKLLHVLQDGEFSRLGGKRQLQVDARVIASTNRKLEEAVSRGEFRDDLYFRLNVIRIKIPPLRERKDEISDLANHFVRKYSEKYESSIRELSPKVLQTFLEHNWPGNIRQLENVIKRYLILPKVEIEITDFPEQPRAKQSMVPEPPAMRPTQHPPRSASYPAPPSYPPQSAFSSQSNVSAQSMFSTQTPPTEFSSLKQVGELAAERAEREVVLWMLEQTSWNRKLAARRLNICYKALLNKIKKWEMRRPPSTLSSASRRRMTAVPSAAESERYVSSGSA